MRRPVVARRSVRPGVRGLRWGGTPAVWPSTKDDTATPAAHSVSGSVPRMLFTRRNERDEKPKNPIAQQDEEGTLSIDQQIIS